MVAAMICGSRMLVSFRAVVAAGLVLPVVCAAAASRPPVLIATTTSVAASAASISRDAWVTFTATVSSASGTPTGSVTFTDASNGSILDTAPLSIGTAAFSTAALAPGYRSVVASYSGNSSYSASTSSGVAVTVAAAGSLAVTYQVDPHHDGRQAAGSLAVGSLARKWHVTLGGSGGQLVEAGDVSYPIMAHGRVFVTVANTDTYGTHLYALSASTGAVDWSLALPGDYTFSALAYDGRRLFALNENGLLKAFVASTGRELWAAQMPDQLFFSGPPTAYDGVVYLSGASFGGTLYAVSEADGVVRWTAEVTNGQRSAPAVDDTGVYVSYACQQADKFSLTGQHVWHFDNGCEGGGGTTPVVHGSYVYVRGPFGWPEILSKSSGVPLTRFVSDTAPAFDSTNMYTVQNGKLVAEAPSGRPKRWTFGDGTLVTAPVVSGGVVYIGSSSGSVYGVSASSGAKVWSRSAGSVIAGTEESQSGVLIGMSISGGLLVVPAGNALTAFAD